MEDIYPLSPMQKGLLFHVLYAPERDLYFRQMTGRLLGNLNVTAFRQAWQMVMDRHTALRTYFVWEGMEAPVQVVCRQISLPWCYLDLRKCTEDDRQHRWQAFLAEDSLKGFDLGNAPLLRVALLQFADDVFEVVFSYHHLVLDGWSVALLQNEVFTFYEACRQGQRPRLPSPPPYRNYIAWLKQQDPRRAEDFWSRRLDGFSSATPLPLAERDEETGHSSFELEQLNLSESLTSQLGLIARKHQLTLNTLALGAWGMLLSRYSGEPDVVFGAVVSGRPPELPHVEQMVGLFINMLPVRVRMEDSRPLFAWLQDLQKEQVEARQFEYSILADVQRNSGVKPGDPLFRTCFVFENYATQSNAGFVGETSLRFHSRSVLEPTNYSLGLNCSPGSSLALTSVYRTNVYTKEKVKQLLRHLGWLLEQIAERPEGAVGDLKLLTSAEFGQVIDEWNRTDQDAPFACIQQLVEQQVENAPQALAICCGEQQLTYQELNQRANQLAHYLMDHGVRPETRVGICVERSLEMVVAILAVLKAGGAYVPLDTQYPPDRLAYMLGDAQAELLLTQSHLVEAFSETSLAKICLNEESDRISRYSARNPENMPEPENLAYIIYTSGSMGKPKGVLVSHSGLTNAIAASLNLFGADQQSRILQLASLTFDASVLEIFVGLVSGGQLYLTPAGGRLSAAEFADLIEKHKINMMFLPPSLLGVLERDDFPHLRTLVVGGETCPLETAFRWSAGRRLLNAYGPTEITIYAAAWENNGLDGITRIPIGKPIRNMQCYVCDRFLRPLPVGVTGDLYVGGIGLARGYWNRPALTAERFVPNPFSDKGERLYWTGDNARYRDDGNLEFLGRRDDQVKLRGYRIELGEIEAVLREHPAIRHVAVVASENVHLEKFLTAYVVGNISPLQVSALKDYLKRALPEYMVPAAIIELQELPLTQGGKLDRSSLPQPKIEFRNETSICEAPQTQMEEIIAGIWAKTLGLERVGRHDNFFEIGGHSLLATRVISRIRQILNVEIPLRSLFTSECLLDFAGTVEQISKQTVTRAPEIAKVTRDAELPLSYAQERLWFIEQLEPGNTAYNLPMAVRLRGELDVDALGWSLKA
ncbi:MAG TPA: amino acid adenylation domain-containing protein, partial [Candidatus Angelobacter sp.]